MVISAIGRIAAKAAMKKISDARNETETTLHQKWFTRSKTV